MSQSKAMHYVPPSQRLFQSRHRVSRKDLKDCDLVLDVDVDARLYGVPLVGPHAMNFSGSESEASSIFSEISSDSAMDICSRMQSNLSVECVIQDNKKRISQEEQTLRLLTQDGGGRSQAKHELQRLKDENRCLLRRRDLLERRWCQVRNSSALLIESRRNGLYWFGLPADLRVSIYQCCLTQVPKYENDRLFEVLCKCLDDNCLAQQMFCNLRHRQSLSSHIAIVTAKLHSHYPGLLFHLQTILQLDVLHDFVQPLLYHSICNALEQHAADGIALELLDILVVSMPFHELDTVLLDDLLIAVLAQTHYKFFSDKIDEFKRQLKNVRFELVTALESMRQRKIGALSDGKLTST